MVLVAEASKRARGDKDTFACPHCGNDITLVGTKEAVELLGAKMSTFHSWREREDFPAPTWDAGQGALWRKEDLLAWHEGRSKERARSLADKLLVDIGGLDEAAAEETLRALMEALEAKGKAREESTA